MRNNRMRLLMVGLLMASGIGAAAAQGNAPAAAPKPTLTLTSSSFSDGSQIPDKYGCVTKDFVSPALSWSNTPKGTESFVLLMHDPEGHPMKSMFDVTHWIVWNIPATATMLPEAVPVGADMPDGAVQGKNVRGVNGYQAPCPPPGKAHHYTFELYALDTKLDVPATATRADVLKAMDGHVIGSSDYIGMFHR